MKADEPHPAAHRPRRCCSSVSSPRAATRPGRSDAVRDERCARLAGSPSYAPSLEPAAAVLPLVPADATTLTVTDLDEVRASARRPRTSRSDDLMTGPLGLLAAGPSREAPRWPQGMLREDGSALSSTTASPRTTSTGRRTSPAAGRASCWPCAGPRPGRGRARGRGRRRRARRRRGATRRSTWSSPDDRDGAMSWGTDASGRRPGRRARGGDVRPPRLRPARRRPRAGRDAEDAGAVLRGTT